MNGSSRKIWWDIGRKSQHAVSRPYCERCHGGKVGTTDRWHLLLTNRYAFVDGSIHGNAAAVAGVARCAARARAGSAQHNRHQRRQPDQNSFHRGSTAQSRVHIDPGILAQSAQRLTVGHTVIPPSLPSNADDVDSLPTKNRSAQLFPTILAHRCV